MKEIIFLNPVFKQMIWGGNNLKKVFNYDIDMENVGECWAIAAHENGDCVVSEGTYSGTKLSKLWEEHRELFGNINDTKFPLLVKIIDAKDDLSIQVHPNDEYANKNENGSKGKTECWYILDCEEDAKIVIGHNAKTKDELVNMINEGKWNEFLNIVPIKKGDMFQINPGTVHAIKGGTLILETQQNSDITYRVYDYDRLSNGKKRELHIQKSIDVITVPSKFEPIELDKVENYNEIEKLVECDYYKVMKVNIKEEYTFEQKEPFLIVSVIDGNGEVDGHKIKKGDHFIIPFEYGKCTMKGNFTIITSTVPAN